MATRKRLRQWNDLSHAAAWLSEQSGECWEALDLADASSHNRLRLYVHLRWPPDANRPLQLPRAILEGCMVELCFFNDVQRLTQTDEFPLHIVRLGEGDAAQHLKFDPGLTCTLDECRVKETDLLAFLDSIKTQRVPGKVEARKAKIIAILSMIEKADPAFSRQAMPGRKVDFFALCQMLDHEAFAYILEATFADNLKGLCSFKPGARKDDYYQNMAAKLGWKSIAHA